MQHCPDIVLINRATYTTKFGLDLYMVFSQDIIQFSNSWWLCTCADNPSFSPQFLGHIELVQWEIPPGSNWEERKLQFLWSDLSCPEYVQMETRCSNNQLPKIFNEMGNFPGNVFIFLSEKTFSWKICNQLY